MSRFATTKWTYLAVLVILVSEIVLVGAQGQQPPRLPSLNPIPSDSCPPAKVTTRVGDAVIVSETQGIDLHPYLDGSVLPLIRANWFRLVSKSGEKTGGDATMEFTILRDGSLAETKLTDGAGHAALGDLAQSAVTKSAPFPALPVEFGGASVSVRARFFYEPGTGLRGCSIEGQTGPAIPLYAQEVEKAGPGSSSGTTTVRVVPPRVIYSPPPPNQASGQAKYSGTATLQATITADGSVEDIKVLKSLGPGLDQKAVDAVKTWKFEPATKDGKPIAYQIIVEVDFHLY